MASGGRVGQGIVAAFGTSSFAPLLHRIGGTEVTRDAVETTDLSIAVDSEKTYVAGDLIEAGQFDMTWEWNASLSVKPPITGAAETLTISFPLRTGQSVKATLAGTGFFIRAKSGDVEVGATTVMMGEGTWKWDGLTGPTYTSGS